MKNLLYIAVLTCLLVSCTTSSPLTRGINYPKVYEEKPIVVLIMPPVNKTVHVEAKEFFYTSLAQPLSEKGYYVISPFLAMDMLRSESAYDSEMFIEGNLSPFNNVFGADVAFFTTINRWEKSVIGNTITVEVEYMMKSTQSNEILFDRKGTLSIDTSLNSGNSLGVLGMLVDLAASAINTALTDKIVAARRCNNYVLRDLPEGYYSPMFNQDQNIEAGEVILSGVVNK